MTVAGRAEFNLSFATGETASSMPSVSDLLAEVRSRREWDAASIAPADSCFPLLGLDWHEGRGFVVQCFEFENSRSDFLSLSSHCGPPVVEVHLGGQALERWPVELFVSDDVAGQAVECFLSSGKQDSSLHWVRIDAFPRETIWEGREQREAWERAND